MPGKPESVEGASDKLSVSAEWSSGDHLELQFVDSLHLAVINDQYYLTFGQFRLPVDDKATTKGTGAEIRPMARLVLSVGGMEKVLRLLTENIERISK
jgi:hypothetical protein